MEEYQGRVKEAMTKIEHRKIAIQLMNEQLENTPYSLERREYDGINESDKEAIIMCIHKICQQFRKRYNAEKYLMSLECPHLDCCDFTFCRLGEEYLPCIK